MQDLSTYQSDPGDADPGAAAPAPAQHRAKPMMRSKSESYNKGEMALTEPLTFSSNQNGISPLCRRRVAFAFQLPGVCVPVALCPEIVSVTVL